MGSESEKHENLIVNPTLLTLAIRRGDIDCGGVRFIIVGCGSFPVLALMNGRSPAAA